MGTRADFYVGRGKDAEWIGSIRFDGYPGPPPALTGWAYKARMFDCMTEEQFRAAVEWIDSQVDHCSRPGRDGWPWSFADSRHTDWIYAFEDGHVWITSFGHGWRTYGEVVRRRDELQPIRDRIDFNFKHGDMERVGMLEEQLEDLHEKFWHMDGPKHELPDMSAIAPHAFKSWEECIAYQRRQREEYEQAQAEAEKQRQEALKKQLGGRLPGICIYEHKPGDGTHESPLSMEPMLRPPGISR